MAQSKHPAPNYAALSAELEHVMTELQREDLDIDEALKQYERGLQLVKELEAYLATAENRVTEFKTKFSQP